MTLCDTKFIKMVRERSELGTRKQKKWWYTSKCMTPPFIGSFSVVDKTDFSSFEEAQKKALALNKKHTWVLVEEHGNG